MDVRLGGGAAPREIRQHVGDRVTNNVTINNMAGDVGELRAAVLQLAGAFADQRERHAAEMAALRAELVELRALASWQTDELLALGERSHGTHPHLIPPPPPPPRASAPALKVLELKWVPGGRG